MALRSLAHPPSRIHDLVFALLPPTLTAGAIAYALMVTLSGSVTTLERAPETSRVVPAVGSIAVVVSARGDPAITGLLEALTVYIVGSSEEARVLADGAAFVAPPGQAFRFIIANSREEAQAIRAALLTTYTPRRNDSSPVHVVILGAFAELHTS